MAGSAPTPAQGVAGLCIGYPVTPEYKFDGTSRGWCVFEPGSGHYPTGTDGEALILYMLPDGKIDYTDRKY